MRLGVDYILVSAQDTKPGDEIVFACPSFNYVVEDVDATPIGQVRHMHGSCSASSSYAPGELLRVALPRAA